MGAVHAELCNECKKKENMQLLFLVRSISNVAVSSKLHCQEYLLLTSYYIDDDD